MSKKKCAVYGKDETGEMHLLIRGVPEPEAVDIANRYYKETGRTAVIVDTEGK